MTITDEMVERAARALYESDSTKYGTQLPWDNIKYLREDYLTQARAAIEAALSECDQDTVEMTDNIAALIERANEIIAYERSLSAPAQAMLHVLEDMVDALSRLSTPPLPEDRINSAAQWLAENVMCYVWEGMHEGRIVGYPAWRVGGHANARKEDYRDVVRKIVALASPVPPLPDEITGLIKRLVSDKASPEERTMAAAMISAALRALAQENGRLDDITEATKALLEIRDETIAICEGNLAIKANRIRELEAERNAIRALNTSLLAHNRELLRDIGNPAAIRALADADLPTAEDVRGILK
jgi:hypothetical protein